MNLDSSTIDRIVAGVLTQLGAGADDARGELTTETQRHGGSAECVVIDAGVVTAQVLLQASKSASQVTVSDRAIVTPAAWDAAKEQGIEIIRSSPRATPRGSKDVTPSNQHNRNTNTRTHGGQPVGVRPLMIVVRSTDAIERLFEDLRSTWQRELLGCPDDAASLATSAICRGDSTTVVILAEQTHRAACFANRNERVKAVAVRDAGEVRQVRSQLRANVWCIDPTDRSWFELRNLLKAIS